MDIEKNGCGASIVLIAAIVGAVIFSEGGMFAATVGFGIGAFIPTFLYEVYKFIRKKITNSSKSKTINKSRIKPKRNRPFGLLFDKIISQVVVSSLIGITTYIVSNGDISITSISGIATFFILKSLGITSE